MQSYWAVSVIFSILVLGSFPLNDAFALDPPPFDLEWGSEGTAEGEFKNPLHVAVGPSGDVYVTDHNNHRIQVFDSDGTFLRMWGWGVDTGASALETCTSGCQVGLAGNNVGQFLRPAGIGVDSAGNVYVTDQNNSVQKFTSTGTFILEWFNSFNFPEAIAFNSAGKVYVANPGAKNIKISENDGTSSTSFGSAGSAEGQFQFPRGVAFDTAGNLYVADTTNQRIQVFDSSNTFLRMWGFGVDDGTTVFQICTSGCQSGQGGTGDGQFSIPREIAIGADGNVYVTDSENDRIQVFDSDGTFLTKWGSLGTGEGEFDITLGIAEGSMYVVDFTNHRIQKFSEPQVAIGGTILPIDTTALLLAGVQSISMWWILGVVAAVGIGFTVFTLKPLRIFRIKL